MGRAKRDMNAAALAGFEQAMSGHRSVIKRRIYSASPTEEDRAELNRLFKGIEEGYPDEAFRLLSDNYQSLTTYPLLAELLRSLGKLLVARDKKLYTDTSINVLESFGFSPDVEHGRWFETEKMQEGFDRELKEEIDKRLNNLLKVGGHLDASVISDKAYRVVFAKYAGAQCFQQRERICRTFLGGQSPPPNLAEVTAWREAVIQAFETLPAKDSVLQDDGAEISRILLRVKPTGKKQEAAPRRRQRYLL